MLSPGGIGAICMLQEFKPNPFRTRPIEGLGTIVADRTGSFVLDTARQLTPVKPLDSETQALLHRWGLGCHPDDRLERLSYEARVLARQAKPLPLDYLILVPTLRCDLACSYCQVSRVQRNATGFDWSEETITRIEALIDGIQGDQIKIEFQGGEPTLRLDIIERIIARCDRFSTRSFVICTNLSNLSPELIALLDREEVLVSTSLDGDAIVHRTQRTHSAEATERFRTNLGWIVAEYGPDKVSALPTIDQDAPPEPDDLIDSYVEFGLHSVYLRPINFQGFARKRHSASQGDHSAWWAYHERFLRRLIALNFEDRTKVLEESYFSLCLRRIFRIGLDRHVDLRNPNPMGTDYLVIDYDGTIYPTDEARMLTRSGVIDLGIGSVRDGIDTEKRDILNSHSTTANDPDCEHCPYQAYCGRDIIDDLSRYGRIDLPRPDTFFCQRHLAMFDLAMRLIYSDNTATQYSLAKWLGLASDKLPELPKL